MRRSSKIILAIDALVWIVFILMFFILPAFFGFQTGAFGYIPFFLFILPILGRSRRKKPVTGYSQDNSQQDQPATDTGTVFKEKRRAGDTTNYSNLGDYGSYKEPRRISWQLVAFILILLSGISFLILWYSL
ncbi:MAG: hypothetical protein QW597_01820 [Thermoplasmataceae archaeon]